MILLSRHILAPALCVVVLTGSTLFGARVARSADVLWEGRCGRGDTLARTSAGTPHICPVARPVYPNQFASAHFVVHYASSGGSLYAQAVSEAAEKTYRVLIDTLAYVTPPSDGSAGGDSRTDIYVRPVAEMGGAWGSTFCEIFVGGMFPNAYTAWATVVDTLSLPRMQTVTAHEYFHVVQLGYDADENVSFLEMLSTWCEERVYDANNIYYEVLPGFFDRPERALFGHIYSNVVWSLFLSENYGDDLLRSILHQSGLVTGTSNALLVAAHDAALAAVTGTTFLDELTNFTLWNYSTGARDDGSHYREGAAYPEIAVEKRSACYPFFTYMTTSEMGTYGSNYFFFDGNGATDSLRLRVNPEYFGSNILTVTKYKGGTQTTETRSIPAFTLVDSITLGDWSDCDSVLAIMHAQRTPSDVWMSAYFVAAPPPTETWMLVLDRDDCRQPFNGVGDEFSDRDGQEGPWSEALRSLGIPYVQSVSIPSDLSMCGGAFITGGWNSQGPNLSDVELIRLMTYMDGGGHVYLESRRFGRWGDPGQVGGTPNEELFFSYFGASFVPGDSMDTGNVSSWATDPSSELGAHVFDYDGFELPDNHVGSLMPVSADTLATDSTGDIRMVMATGPMDSRRIHSTVLLGGSVGVSGSTREQFVSAVINLFGTVVPALSVVQMNVAVSGDAVTFEGELTGYSGEPLALRRYDTDGRLRETLDHEVVKRGGSWRFSARDEGVAGRVTYRLFLTSDTGTDQRVLWTQSIDLRSGIRPLAFPALYPNPSRGSVQLVVESDVDREIHVDIYDVAGRRVHTESRRIGPGDNTLLLDASVVTGLPAGMYFVRVRTGTFRAQRKLVILH